MNRRDEVLAALAKLGPSSTADLAAYAPLRMDQQGARNHLLELHRLGRVRPVPGKPPRKYELVTAGQPS